jgi:putative SOS response-associated peptidase YedK
MCFTVNVNIVKEELERRYDREFIDPENYRPSYYYHAFSLPFLPVITDDSIQTMQWGLIPSWTRGMSEATEIRVMTFNARSESVEEKPAFSASFSGKRCIVPVSGFFEYQHKGSERIPWYIYPAEGSVLSLGGLWNEWTDKENNRSIKTFTIVTTEANQLLSEIHNSGKRMPLVLSDVDIGVWLKGESAQAATVMKPAEESVLSAHTISPLIKSKSSEKNIADLIKPYAYYTTGTLF